MAIILIILTAYKQKFEIEVYMSKTYEFIRTLVSDPSVENLAFVQKKVRAYIYVMLSTTFQIITKYIIPLLFLCIIL